MKRARDTRRKPQKKLKTMKENGTNIEVSVAQMKALSPVRNSSQATDLTSLVDEQLKHFGIDSNTEFGKTLARISTNLYTTHVDVDHLWNTALATIKNIEPPDAINRFNALKFLSFQLAKLLDTVQNPNRALYQSLNYSPTTVTSKGPYPVFDNVTAIFSATPVITRTATYIYACADWIADAFNGREFMLEMYSRMLNPTSICLANHIVDLEAGKFANEYLAWNFNSGMAAIDATLAHVLGREDVIITARNIYGGAYQLINHWYSTNLQVEVVVLDGYSADDFSKCLASAKEKYKDRLERRKRIHLYIESPCNPHGYVMDVAGICERAHENDIVVMLDSTVGTPFLCQPLQREDEMERPDYVIHSYTKDLSGLGGAVAGCAIGKNENMFIPKGHTANGRKWSDTMYWSIYFVKGSFLNADAAFEVMQGMRTLSMRMLSKCINTVILARYLNHHPDIKVQCNAIGGSPNSKYREQYMHIGLPAPLFTIDMKGVERRTFQRFFDSLSPTFGHMISLGQSNTIISCPSLTTHSEMDDAALKAAGMSATTIRFAVGDESPCDLIRHLIFTAKATIDPDVPGFSDKFMNQSDTKHLITSTYLKYHQAQIETEISEGMNLKGDS